MRRLPQYWRAIVSHESARLKGCPPHAGVQPALDTLRIDQQDITTAMGMLVSRHRPNRMQSSAVAVVVAMALFALGRSWIALSAFPGPWALILPGVMSLLGAWGVLRFLQRKDVESMSWTLGDDALIRGRDADHRIQLSEIVELSRGVPVAPGDGVETHWHQTGLVLKVRDGRILALNLLDAEGGAALMQAIEMRCAARFTTAPRHTERELAWLQRMKWNVVGRASDID